MNHSMEGGRGGWPHGDICDAELRHHGLDPRACIDFAVNVDPRGPHPRVRQAFERSVIARYPDPQSRALRVALARRDRLSVEEVLVGPGVTGLLWSLFRAQSKPCTALLVEPSFAGYRSAAEASGSRIRVLRRAPELGRPLGMDALARSIDAEKAEVIVLGSPDNPTGDGLDYDGLEALASANPRVLFVLDEAFLRLSEDHRQIFRRLPENVLRMRSLTKELGIPGLRVGYVVGTPRHLASIRAQIPPWSVSGPALAAAEVGVSDPRIVEEVRLRMRRDTEALRATLSAEMGSLGWRPAPTRTVYTLVEVGDASAWQRRLFERGILVRDCSSFGLPGHLRLCGRSAADRAQLFTHLRALAPSGADRFEEGARP